MSNTPYNTPPFDPSFAEPPVGNSGGSGCGRAALGCGIVVATVLVIGAVALYLAWPGFVGFTVQNNLVEFRDAVEKMNLDPAVRTELVDDFNQVRLSVDDHENFAFMQWIEIGQEVGKLLEDGKLSPDELTKLRAEIKRMKKIQGLEGK